MKVDGFIDPQQVCDLMHTALESLTDALESNSTASVRRVEGPCRGTGAARLWRNRTEVEFPENACVHLLFEKQVGKLRSGAPWSRKAKA